MSPYLASLRALMRAPQTREFLLWMLPALLLGLILRVTLMTQLPYGFYHDDTPDFLTTPDQLIHKSHFELHSKKTFLVPIVFTVPFLVKLPALIAIPVIQHVLGLVTVLLIGLLCRLWFRGWKFFLLPLTLLAAANPYFIWYEHTLMAETIFIFTTVLVAVAGTLYTRDQSPPRFFLLCAALFLEAGARPEGKLLFGFGILLVLLLHLRGWRSAWPRLAIIVAVALVAQLVTQTSQAGLLLYTSVARLTPTDLKIAPGFEPYIEPIRTDLQKRWDVKPSFPKVRDRRAVADAVDRYLKDNPTGASGKARRSVNEFCKKLAVETCLKNFSYLPIHIYHKFRMVAAEPPCGRLDNEWLFGQQYAAYSGSARTMNLAHELTGKQIETPEQLDQFFSGSYASVPWFNDWLDRWTAAVNYFHFPDLRVPNPEWPTVPMYHRGVPYYFLIGAIGLVIIALRRDPLQVFHIVWGLTLLGFFYTIMLTANVRPRFRFVFEPFWFIYIGLLLECLVLTVLAPFRRRP